jgi:MarR family transcriptional regulator, transcriptional regulator for hemolysin
MHQEPSLCQLTNVAARLFRRLADRKLAPLGLSAGYMPVLSALIVSDALSQKALTERAEIEQSTMAATLSRMERDGIIERRADPTDGRSALFSLSPATRASVAEIESVIDGMSEDALAGLPDEERRIARRVLDRLVATLKSLIEE